jgi:hypothetical protein
MARSRYGLNWDKDPATQVWQFGLRRQEILDIADAMVNNGILDAGYNIILIESGFWYSDTEHSDRTADGKIFERSIFSMWAMQSVPLMLATYPLDLNQSQPQANRLKEIVLNREMITINQDPLGRQAEKVREDNFGRVVYSKILSGSGRRAVMLLNRTESPSDISFYFSDLGLKPYSITKVRDLWTHKDIGSNGYSMTFSRVPAHASIVLAVEGSEKLVDQILLWIAVIGWFKAIMSETVQSNREKFQTPLLWPEPQLLLLISTPIILIFLLRVWKIIEFMSMFTARQVIGSWLIP